MLALPTLHPYIWMNRRGWVKMTILLQCPSLSRVVLARHQKCTAHKRLTLKQVNFLAPHKFDLLENASQRKESAAKASEATTQLTVTCI